jgi:hypothetical protein
MLPFVIALAILTPTAALAATTALPGTYARTADGERLTLRLASGGTHTFRQNGDLAARGRYTLASGHRITFRSESGPRACDEPGTYRWKLRGRTLTFEEVDDDCLGRQFALTDGAWKRP